VGGSGDNGGVKTEKEAAERGDDGASQEVGVQVHFAIRNFVLYPRPEGVPLDGQRER
jgi:hypothetical protein